MYMYMYIIYIYIYIYIYIHTYIYIYIHQGDESCVPFGLKDGVRKRRRMHTAPDKSSG